MKKFLKTLTSYAIFSAFYISLWTTFVYGENVYINRFHNFVTAMYVALDLFLLLVVGVIFLTKHLINKGKLGREDFTKFSDVFKVAFEHYNKWYHVAYRFLGFYAAMFCAGILLGYVWLFTFMLIDAVLFKILYAQMSEISKLAETSNEALSTKV